MNTNAPMPSNMKIDISPQVISAITTLIADGTINLESILREQEERENMKLLDEYPYKIFHSGNRWYCRLPDGRRMTRKNKEDLEKEIIKIQRRTTSYVNPNITVNDAFTSWNQYRLDKKFVTHSTVLRERATFNKYLQSTELCTRPVRSILQEEWSEFLQELQPGITSKEWARIKAVVKSVVDYARDLKLINYTSSSVMNDIRIHKGAFLHKKVAVENEIYYADELEAIRSYCIKNPDPYTRCILLESIIGERPGELCAIRVEDINLDNMQISVSSTETRELEGGKADGKQKDVVRDRTKTEKGLRDVSIPITAYDFVKELITIANENGGGYLFKQEPGRNSRVGERIRSRQLRRHLKDICENELHIPYKPLHKFRKTYASILKSADVDDAIIISQMGHTDIKLTENIYIKDRKRALERSNVLGKIPELQIPGIESSTDACDSQSHIESHITDLLQKKEPGNALK